MIIDVDKCYEEKNTWPGILPEYSFLQPHSYKHVLPLTSLLVLTLPFCVCYLEFSFSVCNLIGSGHYHSEFC